MNVEAIQAFGAHDEVAPLAGPAAGPTAPMDGGFAQRIGEGLQGLNQQLLTSQVDLQRLATGETQNLHEVMVRLEESRIALQLMLQVRNRALEAYQDVMRMQI
ncbi:MAG: fliE [Ramlibacter sp.]|jgi:flagellar hook-basal body complex protein FliE|nr:fliE [Ramlibacter sp.]MDB5911862.1 fliE [Ramlibacter sp.]